MAESTAAVAALQHERSTPYHWFQGASVRALVDRINACGGPDVARLEVHQHGDVMTFRVVDGDGDDGDPINDSHVCPPFCP